MSDENTDRTTNRRNLLGAIVSGAAATATITGLASAGSEAEDATVEPMNCEKTVYQYKCVDWDCSCNDCTYDSGTIHRKACCEDRYGNIITCGSWVATDDCC